MKGVQLGGTNTILSDQTAPYDNTQNMGATNLLKSLPLLNENYFNIFVQNEITIVTGEEKTIDLKIDLIGCTSELSATLAWYDPPASNGCIKCLVNDLDLLVEDVASSKLYFPNGSKKADTFNNIERVRVEDTTSGSQYRITVKANMLGPGYTGQKYSLVVTGCFNSVNEGVGVPAVSKLDYELATTYTANRKQAGNMFAIKAKVDGVKITSFSIHTQIAGR